MATWNFGSRYRFKVAQGQYVIKTLPKGTIVVEVVVEVSHGEKEGSRLRWSGYLNTPKNAARAAADLRAMGWKGKSWGDWNGLGSGYEFEMAVMADERDGGTFPRAAFPRPIARVNTNNAIREDALAKLNQGAIGDLNALEALANEQSDVGPVPFDVDVDG